LIGNYDSFRLQLARCQRKSRAQLHVRVITTAIFLRHGVWLAALSGHYV
jgi:hypothetical protein